jgi:hypothetical protein
MSYPINRYRNIERRPNVRQRSRCHRVYADLVLNSFYLGNRPTFEVFVAEMPPSCGSIAYLSSGGKIS